MGVEMPSVPQGNGKHPIPLIVLSANNLADSTAFYSRLFAWQTHPMSAELTAVVAPAGPTVSLRSSIPDGFPGMVPYIGVPDGLGCFGYFKDPSHTTVGLIGP